MPRNPGRGALRRDHPADRAGHTASLAHVTVLAVLLDQLEQASGPADPIPSSDGWQLVLAENIGYLVTDQQRWRAVERLATEVGLTPDQILAAPDAVLSNIVVGSQRASRVERLRRCAELAIAGAPWRAFPGIGGPGAERIDLFTGARAVLALDANALRVLARLGYCDPARSYSVAYRHAQAAAMATLPASVPALQRASQILRRHGQTICRRKAPFCASCPISANCPSAGQAGPLY